MGLFFLSLVSMRKNKLLSHVNNDPGKVHSSPFGFVMEKKKQINGTNYLNCNGLVRRN